METTVKDLIEKLSKYDPNLVVIIEPNIDYNDAENNDVAYDAIHNESCPILLREETAGVQENGGGGYEEGDELYDIYTFDDDIDDHMPKKKVLIISSKQFKYGEGE